MRNYATIKTRSQRVRLSISIAMLLLAPFTVVGQELGEPFTGSEILSETVQIDHTGRRACALREAGDVFCWDRSNSAFFGPFEGPFSTDIAGFSELNAALNNDIASITLDDRHLCGIGRVSGVACVSESPGVIDVFSAVTNPPEPDASYLSITDIASFSSNVCGIQTDNRLVCWGSGGINSIVDIPPEAAFLRQLDLRFPRACGIDLNNAVVCWGQASFLSTGADLQFGNVDIATIGPAKQISMGSFGACIIDINDSLECFGRMTNFTAIFSDLSFSNIDVDISLTNPGLCYTTTSGEKDCKFLVLSEGITTPESLESLESLDSLESLLPPDIDVRLISDRGTICYVTIDEVMECTLSNEDLPDQNQFPTAPRNLSVDFFSETEAELTWARPSESRLSDEFASGYEIFRDGVLIERLPVVTSFFDNNTNPAASYEVRATRALIAGASSFTSFLNADDSDTEDPGMPVEPSPPTTPTAPTAPVDDAGSLGLTGTVYSSTALELFYNQSPAGSSAIRYNLSLIHI